MMKSPLLFLVLSTSSYADPQLTSWQQESGASYARIYQSVADETAGNTSPTWLRGFGSQTKPTYAGVSQISYSANWVYIRATGLASHIMGPWYLNAAKTQNFPNFPSNTAKIYRIPRTPAIPASKSLTGLGATGCMVNGVSMFDLRDAFSYVNASGTDAAPNNGLTGDGVWNRDAYHNEAVTFDAALAHQAGNNYHYHAQPVGLRYQLGDHVDYNPTTNRYTESSDAVTKHSPILAWAADGLPVYGPYGYSSPLNPASGLRRMVSGFVIRNGTFGTTNLTATGRTTLPAWAQRIQAVGFKGGPAISTNYALGHYIEDYDYLGDRGYTLGVDFDLNEQNVRWCVTPEFPAGTYAYFTPILASGTPVFPYTTGRQYFGNPTGGNSTMAEVVTVTFNGGPNITEQVAAPSVNQTSGDVTVTWNAAEGGVYLVEASADLSDWPGIVPEAVATGSTARIIETGAKGSHDKRFYRVSRTSLLAFDTNGFAYTPIAGKLPSTVAPGGGAARGSTVTVTITLPSILTNPLPQGVPTTVTLGGSISGASISRPGTSTVIATFAIPAGASLGAKDIVLAFSSGANLVMVGAYTIS